MAIEGGDGQQRGEAGQDVVQIGRVTKHPGQREVVDQQCQQHAVDDAIEQLFVLAVFHVIPDFPDGRGDVLRNRVLYPHVKRIVPGKGQVKGVSDALHAQGAAGIRADQTGLRAAAPVQAVAGEWAVKRNVANGGGGKSQDPLVVSRACGHLDAQPPRRRAVQAQRAWGHLPGLAGRGLPNVLQGEVPLTVFQHRDPALQPHPFGPWLQHHGFLRQCCVCPQQRQQSQHPPPLQEPCRQTCKTRSPRGLQQAVDGKQEQRHDQYATVLRIGCAVGGARNAVICIFVHKPKLHL